MGVGGGFPPNHPTPPPARPPATCCRLTLIIQVQLPVEPPLTQASGGRRWALAKALLMALHLASSGSETVHQRSRLQARTARQEPDGCCWQATHLQGLLPAEGVGGLPAQGHLPG